MCTARLIANPVAHKLKAAAIDELLRAAARAARAPAEPEMELDAPRRAPTSRRSAAPPAPPRACARWSPAAASVAGEVREIIAARARRRATRRCSSYTRALRHRAAREPAPLLVRAARSSTRRSGSCPLELVAGLQVAIANVALVAEAGVGQDADASSCPRASACALREVPGRLRRRVRARRPRALPEHRRDGRRHRARGRRDRRRRVRAARRRRRDRPRDPRHLPPVRRRARLPHGRRAGDRRARLRHRDGATAST